MILPKELPFRGRFKPDARPEDAPTRIQRACGFNPKESA